MLRSFPTQNIEKQGKLKDFKELKCKIEVSKENQIKCNQLVRYLLLNAGQNLVSCTNNEKYENIDQQTIKFITIKKPIKVQNKFESENKNAIIEQKSLLVSKSLQKNVFIQKISQLNQENMQKKDQNKEIPNSLNYSGIFNHIQIQEEKINNRKKDILESQNIQINQQKEENYFQIIIIKSDKDKISYQHDMQRQKQFQHQVKIYPQNKFQSISKQNQKKLYNLSNFSSFNIKNQDNNFDDSQNFAKGNEIQERQFYRNEFIYLIRKIQKMHGKKLSKSGIQKIAYKLLQLIQKQKQQKNQQNLKDITKSRLNKPNSTIENKKKERQKTKGNVQQINQFLSENLNRLNYDGKIRKKSKSPLRIAKEIKMKENMHMDKQRFKQDRVPDKNCVTHKQKSENQLSYKIIMQKKRNQKIIGTDSKRKQNENTMIKENLQSEQKYLRHEQKVIRYESHSDNRSNIMDIKKQNKKNRLLKILIESVNNDKKPKILYFEYLDKSCSSNYKKQLENFCLSNQINQKNINIIQLAVQSQKSILTIKQSF